MTTSDSWPNVYVGQFASLLNGFAFPSEGFTDNGGMPLIRIRDLWNQTTEINYRGRFDEKYVVHRGDLLIGMDGDFDTVKWKGDDALLNQRVCKLESKNPDKLVQDFLFYRVIGEVIRINRITAATTVKHLSSGDVLGIRIELPPKPEQSKIAEILLTLDRAIEQTEALIAKQQRIKTGLMQDLLTKGIDAHGNIRSEATHAFKDSPLGRIPVEWDVQQLSAVAKQLTSGSRGWARYYSSEGTIFLRIGNLTREHINLHLDDLVFVQVPESSEGKRTSVCKGDLLISITADLGIIGVIPTDLDEAYVNQHIALVRLDRDAVYPRFVGHLLNGVVGLSQIDKLNESGAKAGLNLPTVGKLQIVVPNMGEQKRIAELLDMTDKQIERDKANLKKLAHQKIGLMHDLLTGERRVTPLLAAETSQPDV